MTLQEEIQNGESRTLEYKAELPQKSEKLLEKICNRQFSCIFQK